MKKRKKKSQIDRHLVDQNRPPIIEDTLSDREQGEFAQQLDALFQQELGENAARLYTAPEQPVTPEGPSDPSDSSDSGFSFSSLWAKIVAFFQKIINFFKNI